jgi:hypothetical protein
MLSTVFMEQNFALYVDQTWQNSGAVPTAARSQRTSAVLARLDSRPKVLPCSFLQSLEANTETVAALKISSKLPPPPKSFAILHTQSPSPWESVVQSTINIKQCRIWGSHSGSLVVMKVAIFWDIAPCSPYVNRSFGGTFHLHLHGRKSAEQRVAGSSKTSVHIRTTWLPRRWQH